VVFPQFVPFASSFAITKPYTRRARVKLRPFGETLHSPPTSNYTRRNLYTRRARQQLAARASFANLAKPYTRRARQPLAALVSNSPRGPAPPIWRNLTLATDQKKTALFGSSVRVTRSMRNNGAKKVKKKGSEVPRCWVRGCKIYRTIRI
jgi:hypothetical protein